MIKSNTAFEEWIKQKSNRLKRS